jgi:hypothetical protein
MKPKAKTNLEKMGFIDSDRNKTHDDLQVEILSNPEKIIKSILKIEPKDLKILKIFLEQPVVTKTDFIVGYVDCVISFNFKTGQTRLHHETNEPYEFTTSSVAVIEIKTKIDSFGDTLRQINTYKTYSHITKNRFLQEAIFIVASPDEKFKLQFESQDIRFYNFK